MSALLIGFLVVVGSAALFGAALFGRRPIPQSAIATGAAGSSTAVGAETTPSQRSRSLRVETTQRPRGLTAADVQVPTARRIRSALLLFISMFGVALLVGTVLSIAVVGLVLLVA